jgi:hypothetical protein
VVIVAVVVAVAVVLAGLGLAGLLPFFKQVGLPTMPPSEPAFKQASALAISKADSINQTGWGVVYAAGLNSRAALDRPFIGDNGFTYCLFKPLDGVTNVTIPAMVGNVSSGSSASWSFILRNSQNATLGVNVNDGLATVFGAGNPQCQADFGATASLVPSSVLDSSRAMAIANADGGSEFLSLNPSANVMMTINGNFSQLGAHLIPTWSIFYTTCPLDYVQSSGPGEMLQLSLNPVTGWMVFDQTSAGICAAPLGGPVGGYPIEPLGTVFAFSGTTDSVGLDSQIGLCASVSCSFYNVTITAAGANLTYGELAFSVNSPTGHPVPLIGGVAVVSFTGQVLGIDYFTNATWAPMSVTSLGVTTQDSLAIFVTTGPSLVGDSLLATGTNAYSGTVTGPIT